MSLLHIVQDLLIANCVHVMQLFDVTRALDPDKGLPERNGPKTPVKEKQTLIRVNPKKVCYVNVVWQSRGQTNNTDHALR